MAKIYGLFGSLTGKLADTVMAVRNGVQIARKYQPVVFNPSTAAQVAQRAKMKLMSQLSAVAAPVIAIPRRGSVSARNLFTKKNFGAATFSDNTASIVLSEIQLTDSVVAFPAIAGTRSAEDISVYISNAEAQGHIDVDRVVYAMFAKNADGTARYVASTVVEATPGSNAFVGELPLVAQEVVVLAYGVRDNNENARVVFGELNVPSAQDIAKIVTSRTLTETDITLTETKGVTIPVSESKDPKKK